MSDQNLILHDPDENEDEGKDGCSQTCKSLSDYHQLVIDKLVPYRLVRWSITAMLLLVYIFRIYITQGFHVVSYALALYILSLFIATISPKIDPQFADLLEESPTLPSYEGEEFRPFIPRLFEQKFWLSTTYAILISILATFFQFLDIPVFWPILVIYFFALFFMMMKRQILHMIKFRYLPFSYGKPKPASKASPETVQSV
ncbi:retention in endoplasmic reticulum protein 1 [Cichlidogyrus casuarinus]|uniref:Protein RER1 n=1 Tax=Cichlidogyrus casuarinus TaxID=1844966 RepID=A0ABD2Q8U4_9PLAT